MERYSVNWIERIITIPREALILREGNDYELQSESFWREIRRLEWEYSEGLWAPSILNHLNIRTLAGTDYVHENEVINDYQILFDPTIERVFLTGDNNNIVDVFIFNGVVPVSSNTAGNTISFVDGDGDGDSAPNDEDCCIVEFKISQPNDDVFVAIDGPLAVITQEEETNFVVGVEPHPDSYGVVIDNESLKVASCL